MRQQMRKNYCLPYTDSLMCFSKMKKKLNVLPLLMVLMIAAISSCKKDELQADVIPSLGNYQSLADFYAQHGAAEQVSYIDPEVNSIVTGDSLTLIGVYPYSLVDDNNIPATDTVKVILREIYNIKDMVLSHAPVSSNGTVMQSGGMFYLKFSSNNILYKPDTPLATAMPSDGPVPGLQVYHGQPDLNEGIIWTLDSASNVIDTLFTHAFSFDSLGSGWISIGVPYQVGTPANVAITPMVDAERNETVDMDVYLLFPSINSVMNVDNTASPQGVVAYNVPVGMQASAVAIGVGRITNKAYFGKINFTVTSPQSISINVVQMTDQQILDSLTNL